MVNKDVKIGEKEFKIRKIDPIKQFHIVRRMGSILSDVLPVMVEFQKTQGKELSGDAFTKMVTPILVGLSKLSDDDSEIVLFGLLAGAEIKQSGNWANVVSGRMLMFQELELPVLIQIATQVLFFNCANFFSALPQTS